MSQNTHDIAPKHFQILCKMLSYLSEEGHVHHLLHLTEVSKFFGTYALLLLQFLPTQLQAATIPLQTEIGQSEISVAVNSTLSSFICKLEKYRSTIEWDPIQALPSRPISHLILRI